MKYAIYIIVVEDTEDSDMAISDLGVVNMERVASYPDEAGAVLDATWLAEQGQGIVGE